ncbi:hypothetical protein GOB36_14420 [Sinorhizobium meliloti]|uniref:hypothetical protein n=1 Tax=Rhizobium meliloti TaxID=382 RepID=UPI00299E45BB|nr:hypothetical protein [Sinorhizobium meliloti]MDW9511223.1 hypothetical protein [Sinorhizobium meliloti]MDW9921726.1 hypothetical protein [Sinorhizobium meliloti]MDW9925966.1 hypothetical protein [Sinorhizobium meliloti]MDX0032872.1 hypothetical protein [Sinorhizobium meliloti]
MDEIEKQRQEYQQRLDTIWKRAIQNAFGSSPLQSRSWTDPYACADALRHFMTGNYSFLPPNGHLPLRGVRVHDDGKRLLFDLSETGLLETLPRSLRFEYIGEAPIESFFLLELREMRPTGVYESVSTNEQVARIDGEDYDYSIMEHGVWHHDEDGYEVPVPEDAKTVLRLLSGKLLIVSQGSMWNHTNENWNGRHNRMTSDDIRALIEQSL